MNEMASDEPVAAQVDHVALVRQIADDLESIQRMKAELTRQSNIIAAMILAGGGSVTVPKDVHDQVKWGVFCPYSIGAMDGNLIVRLPRK